MTDHPPELKIPTRPHILIVSKDVIDEKMGGTGMRNLEMARALSQDLDVTLAHPSESKLASIGIRFVSYDENRPDTLNSLVKTADIVLISGNTLERFPFLQNTNKRLVVDLYTPFILENLHYYLGESLSVQDSFNHSAVDITNRLARTGDFFICGSERQRDFWLGVLAANGRVNPRNYAKDPTLRDLIDVVTVGFPDRQPEHHPILRGIHPAVPSEARIVLWGGGIWEWLDPLTLVKAWPQVIAQHPEARLIFLGTRHPNHQIPMHKMVEETEALAEAIGEKDRTVLFFEWLTYQEREALLCEANIGVTLHPLHIETRFSIRTRVLDYIWAKLPILISDGDITSEWVREYQIGKVVPNLDIKATALALCDMLEQPRSAYKEAFKPLQARFAWSRVVEPLRLYSLYGDNAPDHVNHAELLSWKFRPISLRGQMGRAYYIWRKEGLHALLERAWRYIWSYIARPDIK